MKQALVMERDLTPGCVNTTTRTALTLTKLYPGISELVSALHERRLQMAVLSNKPDVFTKRMIAHYF